MLHRELVVWTLQVEVGTLNVTSTSPLRATPAASTGQGYAAPAPTPSSLPLTERLFGQLKGYRGPATQPPRPFVGQSLACLSGNPGFFQDSAAVHAPAPAPLPAVSGAGPQGSAPAAAAVAGKGAPPAAAGQLIPSDLPARHLEPTSPLAGAALPDRAPASPPPPAEAPANGQLLAAATAAAAIAPMVLPHALQLPVAPAPTPGQPVGQAAHALAADALVAGAPGLAQLPRQLPALKPMPSHVTVAELPCAGPNDHLTGDTSAEPAWNFKMTFQAPEPLLQLCSGGWVIYAVHELCLPIHVCGLAAGPVLLRQGGLLNELETGNLRSPSTRQAHPPTASACNRPPGV